MLRKALEFIIGKPAPKQPVAMTPGRRAALYERAMIRREASLGATLLGPIPAGHTREFFCLDRHTWIWSEQWYDQASKSTKSMNVRYDFQPRGVLKIVDDIPRGYVKGSELTHLIETIYNYHNLVTTQIYNTTPVMAG